MAKVFPLYSGSSGNSYYIGNNDSGILVDIGRSAKQTEQLLVRAGISVKAIKGIFVTHEHRDHISGIRVFASRYGIPVYASAGTLNELIKCSAVDAKVKFSALTGGSVSFSDIKITPFAISHDCAEGMGYRIDMNNERSAAVLTDTGIVTEEAAFAVSGCDLVILESNHDVGMLKRGPYPYYLKERILSDKGHLSNAVCADFAKTLVQNGTTRIMLAHLSRENNTPQTAYSCTLKKLQEAGMKENTDFQLTVAPRFNEDCGSVIF